MRMETDRRLLFTFATMMLCYGIGSVVMCMEMPRIPKTPLTFEEQLNAKHTEEKRFWEWNIGNGYVSACENAVMLLSLWFGFMRTVDLLKEFQRIEKERRWLWFWNLCDGNQHENHY